jgi:soluble lytic murein transglycosylase-like protein
LIRSWHSALLGCLAVVSLPCLADEPLYYYSEGQGIVITDTPSRDGARVVPGFGTPLPAASGALLPATPYDAFIARVASEYGLSDSLIKSVALVESGFDPRAVSSKGAQGLMQLMPGTARMYGVTDAFDPLQNLRAGAAHLRNLLNEFGEDLTLALAAYNAGSGAVRRSGGVPAYRETQQYVRKVQAAMGRPERRLHAPATAAEAPPEPVRITRRSDGTIELSN